MLGGIYVKELKGEGGCIHAKELKSEGGIYVMELKGEGRGGIYVKELKGEGGGQVGNS